MENEKYAEDSPGKIPDYGKECGLCASSVSIVLFVIRFLILRDIYANECF